MSNISIRVELPGHHHSFTLEVPNTSTIHSIKAEIAKACPGGPRIDGQRLIYAGRLLKNEECIRDIQVSSQHLLTIHLAVHPSAWTSSPPDRQLPALAPPGGSRLSSAFSSPSSTQQTPRPLFLHATANTMPFSPFPTHHNISPLTAPFVSPAHALQFIIYKHECAIAALTTNSSTSIPSYSPDVLEAARRTAMWALRSYGWSWPHVLDEPVPMASQGDGVKYARVVIDGQNYLALTTPHAQPTPLQIYALKTLSYTYSILTLTCAPVNSHPYHPATQYPVAQELNPRLQNLGLLPLRVVENGLLGGQLHALPIRAIIASLVMLALRTLLLVYFFAPSRTPLIALLAVIWISYEIWNAFQMALRGRGRGEHRGAGPVQGNNVAVPQPNPRPHRDGVPGASASNHARSHASLALDTLANVNLRFENDVLSAATQSPLRAASEPSLVHKIQTFVMLLITTLHPALWNRRRTELMRREGRIRTELQPGDGNADVTEGIDAAESESRAQARMELRQLNERRPGWVREYVERVRNAEFADE